jgi:NAD(P) transhydrogenase
MLAAKQGLRVPAVERHQIGGACTYWGTIPPKALRHHTQRFLECNRELPIGRRERASFPDLLRGAESVIAKQASMRGSFYERNEVVIHEGEARFLDPHTMLLTSCDGSQMELSTGKAVIASGSRPYHPEDVDFSHPRILDSDTVLALDHTPRSVTIYGAGVIGCEYASIFRALGLRVNLIDTRSRLLAFLDDESVHALNYHFRDQGVMIRHGEEHQSVEADEEGVTVELVSGKRIRSDVLLWANGRTGNSQGLGLEEIGIQPNHRGQLQVNENYQTALPHIYAVGDIVGSPSLASAAYDQGRLAAKHLVDGRCDHRLVEHVPTGIYTSPEISSVGPTERELTEQKIPYEVGYAFFKSLARAQITGNTVGMLKLLFQRDTLEILAIHCFGDQASEIVHIGQAIMSQPNENNSLEYFINTTFNYPTMAEAYRVAALNGLNRLPRE